MWVHRVVKNDICYDLEFLKATEMNNDGFCIPLTSLFKSKQCNSGTTPWFLCIQVMWSFLFQFLIKS